MWLLLTRQEHLMLHPAGLAVQGEGFIIPERFLQTSQSMCTTRGTSAQTGGAACSTSRGSPRTWTSSTGAVLPLPPELIRTSAHSILQGLKTRLESWLGSQSPSTQPCPRTASSLLKLAFRCLLRACQRWGHVELRSVRLPRGRTSGRKHQTVNLGAHFCQAVEMHIQPWHGHAEFLSAALAGKLSDRATGAQAAGYSVRLGRLLDVCGDGRGVPELGPRRFRCGEAAEKAARHCSPKWTSPDWGLAEDGAIAVTGSFLRNSAHRREAEPPKSGSGWKGAGGACSHRRGKATPALGPACPGEASRGTRGSCLPGKLQLSGSSGGCPGPCSTVTKGETAPGTGRGAQPGAQPQQEQPWAHWHGRMSPETEETQRGTTLHHVPRRTPASLLLSGVGLAATSMHKVAPGLASLSNGRGCSELLIRDIHAHPWLGIWGAPCPDPATRRSCCSCRCYPVQLAEPPALAVVCSSFQLWN